MPLTVNFTEINYCQFDFPFRLILSGSSQSGKTYFAKELLKSNLFDKSIV